MLRILRGRIKNMIFQPTVSLRSFEFMSLRAVLCLFTQIGGVSFLFVMGGGEG